MNLELESQPLSPEWTDFGRVDQYFMEDHKGKAIGSMLLPLYIFIYGK